MITYNFSNMTVMVLEKRSVTLPVGPTAVKGDLAAPVHVFKWDTL